MTLDLATALPCSLDEARAAVMRTRLFHYVTAPLLTFRPAGEEALPEQWAPGTYRVQLRLLGVIPLGEQDIVISFPPVEQGVAIRDAGSSRFIRTWDHRITITPGSSGVRYRDVVVIRAGVLTPVVWGAAQLFFRHRQRRWRQLAATGFAALGHAPG